MVKLIDQFEALRHKLRAPHLFCNPVKKEAVDIVNRKAHLTCYRISIESGLVEPVVIWNQFVSQSTLDVRLADLLCVPTDKVDFKVATPRG